MKRTTFSTGVKTSILENHYRGLSTIIFVLLSVIIFATPAKAQSPSAFAGNYSGEWVATMALEEDHTGTWTISIARDGEVTGTEHDKTSGQKASLSGFIDEDGYIDLFLKYTEKTYKIKGTLTKKGIRLTGTLKQYSGNRAVATLDIILKRE